MPRPTRLTPAQRAEHQFLHAFHDAARLLMLRELALGPRTVGDLADACGVRQASVSHHTAILKRAGVIRTEKVVRHV